MVFLPEALRAAAFTVGTESAWQRADAIRVIGYCRENGVAILGSEVWLRGAGRPVIPSPYIYSSTTKPRRDNERWNQYVERTCEEAADYVRAFDWDPADTVHLSDTPWFCLTMECCT